MQENTVGVWRKCSTCKKTILLNAPYYLCSVSTCNGQRTGYAFCSMQCFESHLPGARHRDAGAIEKRAPSIPDAMSDSAESAAESRSPARIIVKSASTPSVPIAKAQTPQEVLIIASRLKDYIQARSEFNTSASVMDVLSDYVRVLSDRAIDNARAEGRKTVLDRDFAFLKSLK